MEAFFLINLVLVFVSWHWATRAFENGANVAGWFNIFASALNAAVIANHFL
jgi:hypothetical protein